MGSRWVLAVVGGFTGCSSGATAKTEGDAIELYCDDKQFAFFRYSQGGFLATRHEYRVFAQGLAKTDVVDKRWEGDAPRPGSRE